jgi:uncharacterized protein (TIGR00725 family)
MGVNSHVTSILDVQSHITKPYKVCFLGGSAWQKEDQVYQDAYETAKLLAEEGYIVINGGGPGVMKAATLGAKKGGMKAYAVTYYPNKPKQHYEGRDDTNDFDFEVKTFDYFDRTKVMLQTSDIHIVFKGSIGTLSEISMSWINSWIHEPGNKPIILFGEFWNNFIEWMKKDMLLTHGEERLFKICTTPQEVLDYVNSLEL